MPISPPTERPDDGVAVSTDPAVANASVVDAVLDGREFEEVTVEAGRLDEVVVVAGRLDEAVVVAGELAGVEELWYIVWYAVYVMSPNDRQP